MRRLLRPLPIFSVVTVLAMAAMLAPRLRADAAVFDSSLTGVGTYTVHSETTLTSGEEGAYRHFVRVRLANGSTPWLTEDRTYLVGHVEVSNLAAGGPVVAFLSEHFEALF